MWFPPEVKCIYRDSRVSVSANLHLPLRHTCLFLHFLGKQRLPRLSTHKPGAQTALSSLNGGADKTSWHPGTAVVLETKGQSQRHFLVVSNSSTCGLPGLFCLGGRGTLHTRSWPWFPADATAACGWQCPWVSQSSVRPLWPCSTSASCLQYVSMWSMCIYVHSFLNACSVGSTRPREQESHPAAFASLRGASPPTWPMPVWRWFSNWLAKPLKTRQSALTSQSEQAPEHQNS